MAIDQSELVVSKTVLNGFSDRQIVIEGMQDIDEELALERAWHRDSVRYPTNDMIRICAGTGELARVRGDRNIGLIMRFRNPELHDTYPPYLQPRAAATLRLLGIVWRQEADMAGIPSTVRLAATSFTRSQEYQNQLVSAGKFAVSNSTHMTGYTFDLDLSGYFMDSAETGQEMSITMRPPAVNNTIANAFRSDYGRNDPAPIRLGPEHFDQAVPDTLLTAAGILFRQGLINMVPEMFGTPNSALHISTPPVY